MRKEEIYVTCVCGSLVNERNMSQHVEDCLKEDFLKNALSLKISIPKGDVSSEPPKERHVCSKCMRCGYPMTKNEGTLITFYPSAHKSSVTCCSYKCKTQKCNEIKESVCKMCKLPSNFHQDALGDEEEEEEIANCIDNIGSDKLILNSDDKEAKCRERKAVALQFLESISDTDTDPESLPEHEHAVVINEIPSGPPCKQFHVALLPNYNNIDGNEDSMSGNYSLLLQILDTSPPSVSVSTQTLVTTENIGVQVRILGVYPEEVEKLIASDKRRSLPEFDPVAEAAFKSHLATLIPCIHCSRTFSPDRIQKHISCCIERPKTRECVTPVGGEIKR